ncbi:hypothetical protein BS17DRAFT_815630 [Gyrodon lividus]|nr:hypothetical protein BS17DRAFT_815630 [Gyrodon lividus]
MTAACGVDVTKLKGINFPWKMLLAFLVEKGLIIESYPNDVLMPSELCNPGAWTKGINNLMLAEKCLLVAAIRAGKLAIRHAWDPCEHEDWVVNTLLRLTPLKEEAVKPKIEFDDLYHPKYLQAPIPKKEEEIEVLRQASPLDPNDQPTLEHFPSLNIALPLQFNFRGERILRHSSQIATKPCGKKYPK